MGTVTTSLAINVSQNALLDAVAQLDADALSRFADDVLRLKAQKNHATVTANEADLLQKIARLGLNEMEQSEYHELLKRLEDEAITVAEHTRLQTLTDKSERLNAERIAHVVQLSTLWQQPFEQVMTQLGLVNLHGA